MVRTILVPFEGSERSRSALAYASAAAEDARTVALHVVAPVTGDRSGPPAAERYERAFENARDRLAEAREVAGAGEAPFDAEFVYGHPLHEILRYVDRYVVDGIVFGSHGRDGAGELGLGSVAETVVDRAPVPVTVVRSAGVGDGDSSTAPESVLVPFDGSPPAREALSHAIERFPAAGITAAYADYPTTEDLDRLGPRGDASTSFDDWYERVREWHEAADRDPDAVLEIAEEVAAGHDRDIRTVAEAGDPARVVVDRAGREGADHVVVGSHGRERDGTTAHLLGSVARVVVRRSPISVTVVR